MQLDHEFKFLYININKSLWTNLNIAIIVKYKYLMVKHSEPVGQISIETTTVAVAIVMVIGGNKISEEGELLVLCFYVVTALLTLKSITKVMKQFEITSKLSQISKPLKQLKQWMMHDGKTL